MLSTTKKINGVDCPRHAFAYAPSPDPKTWSCPVWIPGDAQKSLNAVKSSLGQFDSAKIPDCERERVWFTLYGALLAYGIETDRRTFAANDAPARAAEPPKPTAPVKIPADVTDPTIAEAIARADHRATELLRSLGLE